MTQIDSKIPEGQLAEKWSNYKAANWPSGILESI